MNKRRSVSIVISAFNEEENIESLYSQIVENMSKARLDAYEIIWVNDGSSDNTLQICRSLVEKDEKCKVVNLIRNFGKEIAMTAGMDHASGDAIIFMDADLQHPPAYLPKMIKFWQEGYDVVLTNRVGNREESLVSRIMGLFFYKLLNILSDIKIPSQSPDFRLIDRKYAKILKKMDESSRMFRGLLNWVGLSNYKVIKFVAPKRFAGITKYNFKRNFGLAVDSIMQFSTRPLRIATYIGIMAIIFISVIGAYTFWDHFINGAPENGYATTIITIVFVSSIQLVFLGIIGEYIGRIHIEVKKRPLYFAEVIEKNGQESVVRKSKKRK